MPEENTHQRIEKKENGSILLILFQKFVKRSPKPENVAKDIIPPLFDITTIQSYTDYRLLIT